MSILNPFSWGRSGESSGPSEYIFEAATLTPERLSSLASALGVSVGVDPDGKTMSVPISLNVNDRVQVKNFYDMWTSSTLYNNTNSETDRMSRYRMFDIMDENVVEAGLTLDTYADECLSVGFVEQPLRVECSDKAIEKKLLAILSKNGILSGARSTIRQIAKYGDFGYHLRFPDPLNPVIDDVIVRTVKPYDFSAITDPQTENMYRFKVNVTGSRGTKAERAVEPWQFVHFKIEDEDTKPYGKGVLYSMRSAFDQLTTLEALLALSRASKVERLLVRIPVTTSDPTSAFAQANAIKSQWKSLLLSDSAGQRTGGRVPSLTDILWLPSGKEFDITTLQSSIDLTSTDDIDHFLDKALRATRLPKGYLYGEDVTDRGGALQAQDLKFARALIPVQDSYINGLTILCMIICAHLGANLKNIKLKVSLQRPNQLSAELMNTYSNAVTLAGTMVQTWQQVFQSGEFPPAFPEERFIPLLTALSIPENVAKLFKAPPAEEEEEPAPVPRVTVEPPNAPARLTGPTGQTTGAAGENELPDGRTFFPEMTYRVVTPDIIEEKYLNIVGPMLESVEEHKTKLTESSKGRKRARTTKSRK